MSLIMKLRNLAPVVLLVSLSACSVHVDSRPNESKSSVSASDRYLTDLREKYPTLNSETDSTLIKYGKSVCGALDRGATGQDLVRNITRTTGDPDEAEMLGYMTGAGIIYFCPRYRETISGNLSSPDA